MATIIKFKRGQSASWVSQNPVLQPGEPGYEMDTGRLKIGNGTDAWLDLPYVGEDGTGVVNAATHLDFPTVGNINYIYKATEEKKLYQWNDTTKAYEVINDNSGSGDVVINFDVIHGGDADGIID